MSVTRYELTVHLVTDAPLHSGGIDEVVDRRRDPEDRTTVARRFARDGRGRPVLTGRSVKGALRAACQRFREEHGGAVGPTERELRQLWGDDGTRGAGSAAPLRASAITVHTVELPTEGYEGDEEHKVMLPTRMGNAIDRYWGSAGDTALFEHEYLPRGKALALTITAEAGLPDDVEVPQGDVAPPGPEQVEKLFALIIGLIKDGRVAFGGRQNAGWGRVALSDSEKTWTLTKAEPGSRAGLEEWLSGAGGRSVDVAPVDCGGGGRMRIEITWDSPTGILVAEPQKDGPGEGADAGAADGAPGEAEGADSEETKPARPLRAGEETDPIVLPGSSVRGALRTRATRIARTILLAKKDPSTEADWSGAGVHEQLAQDPSLVRDLFGSTTHRGALTVLDTLAAEDGPSRKVTHNAGDRWTGGVADGLLYSEEVYDSTWNSIVVELDLDRLLTNAKAGLGEPGGQEDSRGEDRSRAAFCLLGLVLAELAAGTLPLGSRGTRGMGQVEVKAVSVTGGKGLGIEDWALNASQDGAGESLPRLILKGLRDVSSGIERNPRAGAGWEGWSSYLVGSSERPLEDKEERDA